MIVSAAGGVKEPLAQTLVFYALNAMAPRLVLASTSRHRALLLERLGLPFSVEAPGVDEAPQPREKPAVRALRLAREKARAVAARHAGAWVIGSDQVAVAGRRVLDKPGNAESCRAQLAASSGRQVHFHTAVVLRPPATGAAREHVDRTTVRFRPLSEREILRYVELEQPFDCAGGFRAEGLGVALFEAVETRDPTALVGLPLIWLAAALREAGLDPLAPDQS
jgi:septum formation protein